jgi:endonuclease YncB( thermonuclease family)
MHKQAFIYIIVWCSYLIGGGGQEVSADTCYRVRWVDDGDTIVLQQGRRVRYIGVNAPEIQHKDQQAQPLGYKAKAFNKKLVYQKSVWLEFDHEKQDQYGRTLAYVFLKDGTFVNAAMVVEGYAFYLYRRPNMNYNSMLLKSQRGAMRANKGIWRNWREQKATYVGNKRSKRFHLPSCSFAKKIKSGNRVLFSKKWNAFWAGYAPAKGCIKEYWSYGD